VSSRAGFRGVIGKSTQAERGLSQGTVRNFCQNLLQKELPEKMRKFCSNVVWLSTQCNGRIQLQDGKGWKEFNCETARDGGNSDKRVKTRRR